MTQLQAGVARMAGDDPTIDRLQQQVSSEWESCLQRVNELRRADAAIIYAQGGIGDVPYQFQAARILAQTYPEKKLIFVCGSLFLPYFQSAAPANLEVVSSIELAGGTLRQSLDVAILSLSLSNNLTTAKVDETVKFLELLGLEPAQKPLPLTGPEIFARINQRISRYFGIVRAQKSGYAEGKPATFHAIRRKTQSLHAMQETFLWKRWGELLATDQHPAKDELQAAFGNNPDIYLEPKLRRHFDVCPQSETYAALLVQLFGCDPDLVEQQMAENPLVRPEVQPTADADIVFIYDAKSGRSDGEKVLFPEQLVWLIGQLPQLYPDKKIGLVVGQTHPSYARTICHHCPGLIPIEGSFSGVLESCLQAELVVSVDTGFLHFINFFLAEARRGAAAPSLPKVLAVFGLGSPFAIERFRPTELDALVVAEETAGELDPRQLLTEIRRVLPDSPRSE